MLGAAIAARAPSRSRLAAWGAALAGLGAGLLAAGGAACADAGEDACDGLPMGKLACRRGAAPPRTPAVLLACGSFNPPTVAHMRMFDLAAAALAQRGIDVWGAYMSPVADAYGKAGLAPVQHRLAMCRLAAAGTDCVMVDAWEASQPGYTRTLQVLRRVSRALQAYVQAGQPQQQQQQPPQQQQQQPLSSEQQPSRAPQLQQPMSQAARTHAAGLAAADAAARSHAGSGSSAPPQPSAAPRVMLLCGADMLASIAQPGVWQEPDVILRDHGIVCICRAGTDLAPLLEQPGSLLQQYRHNIFVVEEPVPNEVSSTKVRQLLAAGQPVRFLVPDAVAAYIRQQRLYGCTG